MTDLVPLHSPVLHRPASPIAEDEFGMTPLAVAIDQLNESFDVYFKAYKGVGLAAPQIGIPWQLAVAEDYGLRPTKAVHPYHHVQPNDCLGK
jgi:peptide deformylase